MLSPVFRLPQSGFPLSNSIICPLPSDIRGLSSDHCPLFSDAELCALTRSALNPKIKIETARKLMVKDLWTMLTTLGSSEW